MDILEIIKTRRSIRSFEKKLPPKEVIEECLEAAIWAPNAKNHQPWEFFVAAGDELNRLIKINTDNFAERYGDNDPFSNIPDEFNERQMEVFDALEEAVTEDGNDPNEFFENNLRLFDAPVGIYFAACKDKNNSYRMSTVSAISNFIFAAEAKGLGTCWVNVVIVCQEDIKAYLGIPDNMEIIGAIALGYPVKSAAINNYKRARVSAGKMTRWLGF